MQKAGKKLVASILGWQVRRLSRRNQFKVIAVAGSIGKTSTKLAIAKVLSQKLRVRYQLGNYNDLVSVPLVYFGHDFEEQSALPFLRNPFSWLKLFIQNEAILRRPYPYDVVLIELGPDGPGQMAPFKKYVRADIGVLTAITPEHMEFFGSLEAVAKEELVLAELADKLVYNTDLVDAKYAKRINVAKQPYSLKPAKGLGLKYFSKQQFYTASAAMVVAEELGLSDSDIQKGLKTIKSHAGRMQILDGINGSIIIDDSYNSSPAAVKASLDALYGYDAAYRIAVLGNMNELGEHSETAHRGIGSYCDPKKVDLVITLGPDANEFLAPAAEAKGCKVQTFEDPYTVGEYLKRVVKAKTVVLVKGSQNLVYAEEAIKPVLANPSDAKKLVRQSPSWLKIKTKNFHRH